MDLSVYEIKRIIIKHSNRMRATPLLTRKGFLHSTPFHRTTLSRHSFHRTSPLSLHLPFMATPFQNTPLRNPFLRHTPFTESNSWNPLHRNPPITDTPSWHLRLHRPFFMVPPSWHLDGQYQPPVNRMNLRQV